MTVSGRVRGVAGRARRGVADLGRRIGVLPHQPESWSPDRWTDAYQAGTLDYYGRLDERGRYSVVVGYLRWFGEQTGRPPSVLDVGCGTGLLRERVADAEVGDYVGLDLSPAAIEVAQGRGHPRTRYLVADAMAAEVDPVDVVVVNEVLYYAADPTAFLARMEDRLVPGGLVVVSMWRHAGDASLWRTVDRALPIIDRVEVRNRANPVNRRGWVVAACAPGGVAPTPGSR